MRRKVCDDVKREALVNPVHFRNGVAETAVDVSERRDA
jgi:hypothetical protein